MRLIVNLRKPFVPLEDALEQCGCTLLRGVWSRDALQQAGAQACIVDFCDSARALRATWQLARNLRRLGVPLVALDRDAPWYKGVHRRRIWALAKLRLADLYASHSLQGAERLAARVLYLPNAARISAYNLGARTLEALRDPGVYRYEVSFAGNMDAVRYPEHRPRVEFLHALRERLARESIRLELFDSARMTAADQVQAIQASRINLNSGAAADAGGERSWGLPERCYGVPACGGFLLSDARRHAVDDFVPGKEWADYADLEDCAIKIGQFLQRFEETRRIAEAAHARVLAQHTYEHRARSLMSAVNDLNSR